MTDRDLHQEKTVKWIIKFEKIQINSQHYQRMPFEVVLPASEKIDSCQEQTHPVKNTTATSSLVKQDPM